MISIQTKLILACRLGNVEVFERLMTRLEPNQVYKGLKEQLFFLASKAGSTSMLQVLLNQKDIDLQFRDIHGDTPFFTACWFGYTDIVKEMLKFKEVPINIGNNEGLTPLMVACSRGNYDVVKLLLDEDDIKINLEDETGATALWYACQNEQLDIVQLMLEQEGLDVNSPDEFGWSPLMCAVDNGYFEIVQCYLISKHDVNLNLKNSSNLNVFDIAHKSPERHLINELLEPFKKNSELAKIDLRKRLGFFGLIF